MFPRSPSYGIYISQLTRFARVCSYTSYHNNRNQVADTGLFFVLGPYFVIQCFVSFLVCHHLAGEES